MRLPQSQAAVSKSLPSSTTQPRISVRGKFLFAGEEKLYLRGVTYGPFRIDETGSEYGDAATVESDFADMSEYCINAVRTYTAPPAWFLDLAAKYELFVMVGLPWEQHITFLDDEQTAQHIVAKIRQGILSCERHRAILGYTLGNEI